MTRIERIERAIKEALCIPVELEKQGGTYRYCVPADYPTDEPHPLDDRDQDSYSSVLSHPIRWWVEQLRERL